MSRSQRRHHRERLKKKRSSYFANWAKDERVLGQLVNTACRCSCWMCGGTRKFYGNSERAKTIQEISDLQFEKSLSVL